MGRGWGEIVRLHNLLKDLQQRNTHTVYRGTSSKLHHYYFITSVLYKVLAEHSLGVRIKGKVSVPKGPCSFNGEELKLSSSSGNIIIHVLPLYTLAQQHCWIIIPLGMCV